MTALARSQQPLSLSNKHDDDGIVTYRATRRPHRGRPRPTFRCRAADVNSLEISAAPREGGRQGTCQPHQVPSPSNEWLQLTSIGDERCFVGGLSWRDLAHCRPVARNNPVLGADEQADSPPATSRVLDPSTL